MERLLAILLLCMVVGTETRSVFLKRAIDDACAGRKCEPYEVCQVVPHLGLTCSCSKFCGFELDPVCGTDNRTYGNLCYLAAATCESKGIVMFGSHGQCTARLMHSLQTDQASPTSEHA